MPDLTLNAKLIAARDLAHDNADFDGDPVKAQNYLTGVRRMGMLLPQDSSRESERLRFDHQALLAEVPRAAATAGRAQQNPIRYMDTGNRCRQ